MEIREQARECIQKCTQNAQELRDLADRVPNQQVSNMFSHSADNLEKTIAECKSALNQLGE